MARVAILGMGKIGAAMTERLLMTGEETVVVWNRTPERALEAAKSAMEVAKKGRVLVAATAKHAISALREEMKVVVLVVSNCAAGLEVLDGVAPMLREATVVNLVSGSPDEGREMQRAAGNVSGYVDGAFCGAPSAARAGTGQVFASASHPDVLDAVRPVVDKLGDVAFAGPVGASRALDYAVVDLAFVNLACFCANAAMLEKEGVDWQLFHESAKKRLEVVPSAMKLAANRMLDGVDYHESPVATLGTWRNFWASRLPYLEKAGLPSHLLAHFAVDLLDKAGASHPDLAKADVTRIQEVLRFGRSDAHDTK